MQIRTSDNGNGRTVKIQADEHLDAKIISVVSHALILASSPWINSLEIDLRNTRVIRDAGLSLLLRLCEKSGLSRNHIGLVNCSPEIRPRLIKSKLSCYLHAA